MTEAHWQQLVTAARHASARAYAPYSRFVVGAALMTSDGAVVAGCNVENVSFGLTVCAERNAVFRAIADGARSFAALVVYTPTPAPVTPCGACRQVLAEFGRDLSVRCICDSDLRHEYTLAELLPNAFGMRS